MESTTTKSMHPLTAIAAVSVILFSLAGIGAITGLIPTSHSQAVQTPVSKPADEAAKLAAAAQPAESAATSRVTAPRPAETAANKSAPRQVKPVQKTAKPIEAPAPAARDEAPVRIAQYDPAPRYEPAPRAEPARPLCYDCGVIESVREIEKKGEGSGLGAAVGGVAGGLLGHQTGAGRGKDVMTVLGAIGGAVAGHQIEKNAKAAKSYEIAIRFEDGSSRIVNQDNPPAWHTGDRVRYVNGAITAYN